MTVIESEASITNIDFGNVSQGFGSRDKDLYF